MAAKNSIVTRITLEGAQQITGDLKNLGAAGEKALKQIKTAADQAGSGGAKLAAFASKVHQVFGQAATAGQNFAKSIGAVERSIGTVATRVAVLTTAVAGVTAGFLAFNIAAGRAAEELQNNASAVGLTANEYQKFKFAAEQVGLSTDQFTQAMSVLTDQMQQTKDAVDPAATALGKLGISVTDGFGGLRPAADVLKEFMDRISGMADGTEKTSAVIDIFGRRIGARLVPFLNLGSAGLRDLGNEASRLGAVVSDETLGTLAAFDDSIDKLKATANGARLSLAAVFAPALQQGANALSELIAANESRLIEFANTVQSVVLPIIEDVINAVTGHDADVKAQWVIDLRDNIIEFALATRAAFTDIIIPAFNGLVAIADKIAAAINGIFGTDFTGKELLVAAAILSVTGVFGTLAAVIGVVVAAFGLFSSTAGLVSAAVVLVGLDIVLLAKTLAKVDWAGIGERIKQALIDAFSSIGKAISKFIGAALDTAKDLFNDFITYIEGTWLGAIIRAVNAAISAIGRAKQESQNLSNAPVGKGGLARGGRPGRAGRKGARDTILAWFDPREFVIRPQAVAKLGANVLNFINQAGELPGFAMGGLVNNAGGGSVALSPILTPLAARDPGPRNVLNLSIFGETFGDLLVSDDTIQRLGRLAASKQMTSGGRKPSWFRSG